MNTTKCYCDCNDMSPDYYCKCECHALIGNKCCDCANDMMPVYHCECKCHAWAHQRIMEDDEILYPNASGCGCEDYPCCGH